VNETEGLPGKAELEIQLAEADALAEDRDQVTVSREGDQPLPVPNDGPSMHDLVIADLRHTHLAGVADFVQQDLAARKELGLKRYGSLLQAHNGRDALRDLYEELLDASVYARQVIAEDVVADHLRPVLTNTYLAILQRLVSVRSLIAAAGVN
jgi:hypothetical protein